MNNDEYVVALARSEHIRMLPEIERAAAALFPDNVITPEIRASAVPREQLEAALVEGRLWTAVTQGGHPVGFALAVREADRVFLQEIDVHPDHQRKGLGRRLLEQVVNWAKAQALSSVTLTTFEHVPWNAPFYTRCGFRTLAYKELGWDLRNQLAIECQKGLRQRVAMQLMLEAE